MTNEIRDFFYSALVRSAEGYLHTFDEKSGRFLHESGGWAITLQDPILGYAYLYKKPGSAFYGNPKTLALIMKAVRALRDFQNPDGRMEFIKVDGSTWGPIYMPWTFYHWLETYALLRDDLDPAVRADWEAGLLPGLESYGRQDPLHVHNIPVWQAMTAHRAGKLFDRPDWCENGSALIKTACERQHPDGFWAEHEGPTTGYNDVYVHALGLYRFHGGTVDVLPALARAIAFNQIFHYPNGSGVEAVDGRQKYHPSPRGKASGVTGLTGYANTEGGMAIIRARLAGYDPSNISMPQTASLLLMLDELKQGFVAPDLGHPDFADDNLTVIHGSGSVTRRDGVQISLSAYTAPHTDNRWGLDRLCYIGVWSPGCELVLGGGNSKDQPEHANFLFRDESGAVAAMIPTKGELLESGKLRLTYGDTAKCLIEACFTAKNEVRLRLRVEEMRKGVTASIHVPLKPPMDLTRGTLRTASNDGVHTLSWDGAAVRFSGDYSLTLPSRPFNPYAADGAAPVEEYVALVSFDRPEVEISVSVEK